jgi:hypothetical protein
LSIIAGWVEEIVFANQDRFTFVLTDDGLTAHDDSLLLVEVGDELL